MKLAKLNIICAAALTVFASASAIASAPSTSIPPQKPYFLPAIAAPFVDAAAYPTPSIDTLGIQNGLSQITLGFVTSAPDGKGGQLCSPVWGGQSTYGIANPLTSSTSIYLQQSIQAYKQANGDVSISFGGAEGSLAPYCSSVEDMANALDTVVQAYGVHHLDFDIEQGFVVNNPSNHIDLRSQAIAALQQKYKKIDPTNPIDITLTLPIATTGLTDDGLNIVDSAVKSGVVLSHVNGMAMDYGTPNNDMGQAAIDAATALHGQLIQVYAKHGITLSDKDAAGMIGITPMIGENDSDGETFTIDNANQLVSFAESGSLGAPLGELSFWSLNRDLTGCTNSGLYACSMIQQTNYEFSGIFAKYGRQNVTADPGYVSTVTSTTGGCLNEATQEGQPWNSTLIYGGSKNHIMTAIYNGLTYTAKYWTCDNNGLTPDQSGDWTTPNPVATVWNASATYTGGAIVKYPDANGDTYLANWWNTADKPDGGDGAWTDQTPHVGGGTPAWSPTSAYPIDHTQVTHNGSTWENEWYANPGEEPGKTGGEWVVVK